ncbi:MAG: hypothetical protein IJN91_04240 [Alphaproteobacteria bacterium]|nr:hypothetical protein [Alphaproteobacteria bacterium]
MQQRQLEKLSQMTGVDFNFVPANKNQFGVKYYEHRCLNDDEYFKIAGDLNQYENVIYTCLEYPDGTSSIVVLQNNLDKKRLENILWGRVGDLEQTKPIGKIHGNDVFLDLIKTQTNQCATIVSHSNRAVAVVVINGHRLPFYVSSGISGKDTEYGIPSGKWYPLQGISRAGWLNKMPEMNKSTYQELDQICEMLEQKFPAKIFKQRALNGDIPVADNTALLESANNDFIEGTPLNELISYQYYRNHIIYLPAIIEEWCSAPKDFLEITNGALQIYELNILEKIRKTNIMANSVLNGDVIWFKPVPNQLETDAETIQGIQEQLDRLNVSSVYVSSDKYIGIGVPVDKLDNFLHNKQTQKDFTTAAKKLEELPHKQDKEKSFMKMFIDKVKNIIES